MKLTCDDCGSVQSEANSVCELCGGSLSEERKRAETGSVLALLAAAVVTTGLFCVLPGILAHGLWLHEYDTQLFWSVYLGAWVLGSVLVRFYSPKDDYDFGWSHHRQIVDNPFTLRDNADRAHAGVGLLLFPIGIVSGLWLAVFKKLTGGR